MPYSMVSRSRISPIRMTSGAWRSVFLSAACQFSVSTPTSRCVITQPLCWCTYSTGSSMVDVAAGLLVAVADHGRQRSRLTGARAAHHDHQAALRQHDLLEHGREVELLERGDLGVDETDHAASVALLHEGVHAETADARRRDREVALLGRVEFLGLAVV